jgi:hypothetical protein
LNTWKSTTWSSKGRRKPAAGAFHLMNSCRRKALRYKVLLTRDAVDDFKTLDGSVKKLVAQQLKKLGICTVSI